MEKITNQIELSGSDLIWWHQLTWSQALGKELSKAIFNWTKYNLI